MTNKSQEGSQFCRGFGGIGGILRYAVDTTLNEVQTAVFATLIPVKWAGALTECQRRMHTADFSCRS